MGSLQPRRREGLAGTRALGRGWPRRRCDPSLPGPGRRAGRSWAGGRGYESRRPGSPGERRARAAPASLRLGMSREESLEVAGPGGAARSAVTLGGVTLPPPRASPPPGCRLGHRAGPHSRDRRGPGGARVGEAPVRPALDPGLGSNLGTREWPAAWAQPASVAGQSRSLALPGLCDLGPVSSCLSLPPLRNGKLAHPSGGSAAGGCC